MFLTDLPLEIQFHILELCSPSSLAILSRVHTSLRDVAECALYSHVHYWIQPLDAVILSPNDDSSVLELQENRSLLHTFATNPRKASKVKALYVEFDTRNLVRGEIMHFILIKVAEALEKMPNLVDLRILYSLDDSCEDRLNQVIRAGFFKLHTLYLVHSHDFEGILSDQPHIRLLGIYFDHPTLAKGYWTAIKTLYQSPSRCRTIFALDISKKPFDPTINMIPSFHRPGEALQACRDTASSLSKWSNHFFGDDYELSLSLLGISEEKTNLVWESMVAMAACLQACCSDQVCTYFRIMVHGKSIQKPWRFPEFVKSLALFEGLKTLLLYFLDLDIEESYQLSQDLELCLAQDLGRSWPSVQEIIIRSDDLALLVMRRETGWTLMECNSELEPIESDDEDESDLYDEYDPYGTYYSHGGYGSPYDPYDSDSFDEWDEYDYNM